ncbi:MAG: galactokinase family protein [Longimicrobiales bacterium]
MKSVPDSDDPAVRLFVPGRIEVLGKHTDYAGGRSLLAAVDRGFTVAVAAVEDDAITVVDTVRGERVRIPLSGHAESGAAVLASGASSAPGATTESGSESASESAPGSASASAEPAWAVYPRTVVGRMARDFPGRLTGCRIELSSDLPAAAGLSSSSALITAIFLALDAVSGFSRSERYRAAIGGPPLAAEPTARVAPEAREALAGYLGAVERGSPFPGLGSAREPGSTPEAGAGGGAEGVGTRGGSEDHVAILCAEPGALVRYVFEPVRAEGAVAVPAGHVFVVAASGVVAPKTGSARDRYNRLSDDAARVAAIWRKATGESHAHIGAILDDAGVRRLHDVVWCGARRGERDALRRRVRHFAAESTEIVPAAADALAAGDLARFGELVDRSQALAEELLGNQVPETVQLARSARDLGAAAASAFGAGFGGSVWALVSTSDAVVFVDDWRARYLDAFPGRTSEAAFFISPAATPARTR